MLKVLNNIWVFHGKNAELSSAVFSSKTVADVWILKYELNGLLTKMPLDISIYDWVLENNMFIPKQDYQKTGTFIQKFTRAYLEHYHYINGRSEQ